MAKKAAAAGGNGFDPNKVREYVNQIEGHLSDLLSEQGAYMARCRGIRESITGVYDDAKASGIPRQELKVLIKTRELERKAIQLREDMEADQQGTFDMLRDALGDYANTPLGEAALSRAKGRGKGSTLDGPGTTRTSHGEDDPRPRFMKERDRQESPEPPEAA
jgi:uncharacterized protein (UPF0335 family)